MGHRVAANVGDGAERSDDTLGRVTAVKQPGNTGTTTYVYAGNRVTVTDPAGKWKEYTRDVFGNLVKVREPGSPALESTYAPRISAEQPLRRTVQLPEHEAALAIHLHPVPDCNPPSVVV